ncbi:nucleic acid/nucleotide deaminase domain-containing protein, partial [Xanthomonas oryzae]|uniref:nucleic acid/nucleotide deaminase domain-containing protein n=1 Tax=Xanthomonas oryzae TaxID=347 RepID=UPI00096868B0
DLELRWDPNHRLTESRKAGQTTHYGYDPLGRRVFKRNPTHTTWFYWEGDALLGEVKHANDDPDAAPVWVGNVANLIEAKRRKEKLAKLHERVREYVYYPGTFVPLGLIEKEPQGRSTSALAEQTNESIPSIHVAASPPEVIVASSNTSFKPVAKPSGSMGVLGRGAKAGDQSSLEVKGKGNKNGFPALGKMVLGSSLQEGVSLSSAASGVKVNAVGLVESIESNGDVNAAFKESQGAESLGAIAYLYCVDVNGCPRRILKENGDIVWSASYSVVGAAQPDGWGLLENNIRLQGQYLDSETGLNYNRHRYYDYQSAQFISNDSLRLAAGENLYFYAPNNQVWADPLGLHSIQVTYGSTDLSEMAQLHRMDMGITGGQNVAVFEYLDENGMPNYISQASGDGLHAERRINAQLQKMGIPAENVKRVYSELAPCPEVRGMQYCGRMLENSYPNAQVTHSFEYGASRESRRKGVKELKAAVKKFFTGCDG